MVNKSLRRSANLAMLEFAAKKLGLLKNEVVFVGGCTTALFITDPLVPDVRATNDVDCIIDVVSKGQYYLFAEKLREQGFKEAIDSEVMCRWRYDDLILDVMPISEEILGFSNNWYKEAIKTAITHQLNEDIYIKSVTALYFLGTKIEAFSTRGHNDFFASRDFEDIVTVIDGRIELLKEITVCDAKLKKYLATFFAKTLENDQFQLVLPGLLNDYGPAARERAQVVLKRIQQITKSDI